MGEAAIVNAGEAVADYLANIGVTVAFGVISVHNLPILDAIARQARIRFVPARGEAGAYNMADAYARRTGRLGVAITSTGGGAGNAAGAQMEALAAGSPVLHLTSNVDRSFLDRDCGPIHDVGGQMAMLTAISKSTFRVWEGRRATTTLDAAVRGALSAPTGPVTVEIPIDVQYEASNNPFVRSPAIARTVPLESDLDALAARVRRARRPIVWTGGGAREACAQASELVQRGFVAVTSMNGRGVVPETMAGTLGAFQATPSSEAIYARSDLLLVVGSRLRAMETRNGGLRLPASIVQIDVDPKCAAANYPIEMFVHGDARLVLEGLLARLPATLDVDPAFAGSASEAHLASQRELAATLGPYRAIADALRGVVGPGRHPFVRDVTIASATFGNRYVTVAEPRLSVHAAAGGIGQSLAMGIGAALAEKGPKTIVLAGDGGAILSIGELATAVQEQAELAIVLMNDGGYGIIRNLQDAQFAGRQHYASLHTPDFEALCRGFGVGYQKVGRSEDFSGALQNAIAAAGPQMVEVDMKAVGAFAIPFSGTTPKPVSGAIAGDAANSRIG